MLYVTTMKDLCIQIHPQRAPTFELSEVFRRCEDLAAQSPAILKFTVVEGDDEGPYANLMFSTGCMKSLWTLLRDELYADQQIGNLLIKSSTAMCEGKHGWDDYLQLYHFDPSVVLDRISDG